MTAQSARRSASEATIVFLMVALAAAIFWFTGQTTEKDGREEEHAHSGNSHIQTRHDDYEEYVPGTAEELIINSLDALGFARADNPPTCFVYNDANASGIPAEIPDSLSSYVKDLKEYNAAIDRLPPLPNVKKEIKRGNYTVCESLRLHPGGMPGIFPSGQLSLSKSGRIEPLAPPMRHPEFCQNRGYLMRMDYLVHDFEEMCYKLKPHSRLIFVDMGASLNFHGRGHGVQPAVWLLNRFEKMGFHFDHIYGFEITFVEPKKFYESILPVKYFPSYHWINVGISADPNSKLNPLKSILTKFHEDDLILVKLDVDTSSIEVPLAKQLLGENSTFYSKLIDHFYFEHHVHLGELAGSWGKSMSGTVKESMEMFSELRKKGIPAHYWP